jgi:hypothetical protein
MKFKNPIQDKKAIIEKIHSQASLSESLVNDINELYDASLKFNGTMQSLQNGNSDPIDFLVDIMVSLLGTSSLEDAVTRVVSKLLKKDQVQEDGKTMEHSMKEFIFKSLKVKDNNAIIPEDFKYEGYKVPVKAMDLFDMYKTNPESPVGKLMYGTDLDNFNFKFQSDVLMNPYARDGVTLDTLSGVTFAPDTTGLFVDMKASEGHHIGKTINSFFQDMIMDESFELFDKKKILIDLVDVIYNFLSRNKSKGGLESEEIIKTIIDAVANEREIETVYDFNPKVLEDIEYNSSKRKIGGFTLDLNCEVTNIEITPETLQNLIDGDNFTTNILNPIAEAGNDVENQALKANVFRGLLKSLLYVLLKNTLFSPRVWTLFILSSIFKTGYKQSIYVNMAIGQIPRAQHIMSLIKDKNKLIEYVGNKLLVYISDYLLNMIIKELVKKLAPLMIEIQKEKAQQYKDLLISLLNIEIGGFQTGLKNL